MRKIILIFAMIGIAFLSKAQNPIADFSADKFVICVGDSIQFTNLSNYNGSSIISTNWNFGEGSVSTEDSPKHIYNTSGTFNIVLTVITSSGTDTEDKAAYITVNPLPVTDFTISGDNCSLPYTGIISNTSETGVFIDYSWDFNNGQTSILQNPPNFESNTEGIYNVNLDVTNTSTGCINTKTIPIGVNEYSAGISAPSTSCYLDPLTVYDASTSGTNSWVWVAGNGETSNDQNPTFNYTTPGNYTLQLTAENTTTGCSETITQNITVQSQPSPSFSLSPSSGCAPLTVSYTNLSASGDFVWDFGNGNTYSGQNPPDQTYNSDGEAIVSLTMNSTQGCIGTAIVYDTITIAAPTPFIKANNQGGCSPLTVQFEDSSYTSDPINDPIISWQWNLGDGTSYNGQTPPPHVYTVGKYDITLTITTQNGCTNTISFPNFITVGAIDNVNFSESLNSGCARENYVFTNLSTISAPYSPGDISFSWDFGDGGQSADENPVYTFPIDTGYFDIKFLVNFNGCKDSIIKENQVYIKAPISKFDVDTLICNPTSFPLRVPVTDLSIPGQANDNVEMTWKWENNTEFTLNSNDIFDADKGDTAYVFNDYGAYSVKQIIRNTTIGCTDSTEKTIVISQLIPDFIISSDTLCQSEPITISSTSQLTDGPGFFSFNLGNGVVKNGNPINYTYANSGSFNITLKAFNNAGCVLTKTKNNLIIISTPSASFTASNNDYQCLPLTNNYTNTSVNTSPIENFVWTFPDGTRDTTYTVNESISFPFNTKGTLVTSLVTNDIYGCSSDTAEHTVIITKPDMNFTMDSVYCNNTEITIPNNTIGFGNLSYEWKMDQTVFSTDTNFRKTFIEDENTNELTIDHLITLLVTDEKGCSDSVEQDISISLPKLDYGYTPSGATINENGEYLCPPVFGNFSDSSSSYGNITNWNWTFGDGKSSNLQNPSNTYLYPGTYSVSFEMEDQFGCKDDTLLIDYIKILGPTVDADWTNTNTSCGNEFNFIAQNVRPYDSIYWDLDDNTFYFDSLDFLYSYNSGSFIPKAIVTDTIGCAVTYELPSIAISSSNFTSDAGQDLIVCVDQTNLNATPKLDNSYTSAWSIVQGDILIEDIHSPTSMISNLGTSENILVWRISDGCKYVTDTISVINGFSSVYAGFDDAICAYSYSPLTANSPFVGTGSWSSSDNTIVFDNVLDSLTTVSNLKDGNNELIWTVNSVCGVNSDTVIIFVETPPTIANAGQNDSICGTDYTLNGNTPTTGTGNWTLISGSGTIETPTSPTSNVSGIGIGENIFEWRIENNCNFSTSQVIIKGLEQPTPALCANDVTFCSDTYTLVADTNLIGQGVWTNPIGSADINDVNSNTTEITNILEGENIFIWTISNFCDASSDSVIVIRERSPSIANAGNDITTCVDSAIVNASAVSIGEGEWNLLSGNFSLPSNLNSTNVLVSNLSIGLQELTWTISNTCGVNIDTIAITYIDAPTIALAGEDQGLCLYTTTLDANVPLVGTGLWETIEGSGNFLNADDPKTELTGIAQGFNEYTWTISNVCGSSTDTIVITSSIAPTEANAGVERSICDGVLILNGNEPLIGEGEWSVKKGTGFFHSSIDPRTVVDSLSVGENILVWTIRNACTSSESEVIVTNTGRCPNEDSLSRILYYYVPNSFTPNGDGLNNTFQPVFESGYEPTQYSLLIFNRWGQVMFESYNADYGWNGRLQNNGDIVQDGVYPWVITFTDIISQTERTINGFVVLVK